MNEVVKYHNNMNLVNFNNFNEVELNIFFAVLQQMRDKNLSEIELSFEKIKELTGYKSTSKERFINDLKRTYRKLLTSTMPIEDKDKKIYIEFVLFTRFKIDKDKQTVTIKTNEEFEYILNAITNNFTRFELSEFISLSKTNSKTLYRMLKQFRSTGFWTIDYKEFLELMKMSNWDSSNINKEFKRIVADVAPFFKNLKIEKIKKGNKRTGAIQRLNFMFDKESDYIKFEHIKMSKIEDLEIFLISHYSAGKIIARDEDDTVYYFNDK
ncbi:MAG: replication initiation protein, partial [Campylobacterales bacterium]|nr:replication initiation protein [Campylobacterales bacterium]